MSRDERIPGRAVITEVLSERTYHARLPNGKVIFAFVPRLRMTEPLQIGAEVSVALSLYDFSEGEIVESGAVCSDAVRGPT
jgi:translation initiation factor IF-1